MECTKVVATVALVQEQNRQVEDPGQGGHPARLASQFGNGIVDRDNEQNLEDAVAVHDEKIRKREGEEEVGSV